MVNTSKWPITVDGVRLDSLAWNVSTRTGRDMMASVAGEDIDTGMRDGVIWVPHKKFGPGRMVLSMWVGGTDENGSVPVGGDDYEKYVENLDKLKKMFSVQHRLIDVRQNINASGTKVRQALANITAVIPPEMLSSYPYTAKFTVELSIPGAFWQDAAPTTYDSGAALVANTTLPLAALAAGTAPMRDLYAVVDGPATNPKLIDDRNGHYVQYNGVVANGSQWVVNTGLWTSKTGVGIAFTQNGADVYDSTVFAGGHAPALFGVTADPLGPQARIEGSGFGAATRLRIRGNIKYL